MLIASRRRLATTLTMSLLCGLLSRAEAFPGLWPWGKDQAKQQVEPVQNKKSSDQGKDQSSDDSNGQSKNQAKGKSADQSNGQSNSQSNDRSANQSANPSPNQSIDQSRSGSASAASGASFGSSTPNVPVEFVPAVTNSQDPMAIYRSAGVSPLEERKIRQLAQEFEQLQRVRLKLLSNLLAAMREFEVQTDPDPKAVLAKQDEINKLMAQMATERINLLLAIREVMSFEEKQHLVETLQNSRH